MFLLKHLSDERQSSSNGDGSGALASSVKPDKRFIDAVTYYWAMLLYFTTDAQTIDRKEAIFFASGGK